MVMVVMVMAMMRMGDEDEVDDDAYRLHDENDFQWTHLHASC